MVLQTERLVLREWTEADREAFAALNGDARVMRFMPGIMTREESDAYLDRIQAHFKHYGFGPYAIEYKGEFVGLTGISVPDFDAEFTPTVEIGWRIRAEYQNRGFATEAARGVLKHAFQVQRVPDVVAFTRPDNLPSRRVMEKIGMHYAYDFAHPRLAEDHPFSLHVLYRISRPVDDGSSPQQVSSEVPEPA